MVVAVKRAVTVGKLSSEAHRPTRVSILGHLKY